MAVGFSPHFGHETQSKFRKVSIPPYQQKPLLLGPSKYQAFFRFREWQRLTGHFLNPEVLSVEMFK